MCVQEIYPGVFKPSLSHKFIKMLEEKGKLLRNYTQNIDTLERLAGIENLIECHGRPNIYCSKLFSLITVSTSPVGMSSLMLCFQSGSLSMSDGFGFMLASPVLVKCCRHHTALFCYWLCPVSVELPSGTLNTGVWYMYYISFFTQISHCLKDIYGINIRLCSNKHIFLWCVANHYLLIV